MGKKELKRDLELYKSDLNSMADEAIYYKKRALKAEAFINKITRIIFEGNEITVTCIRGGDKLNAWYYKLKDTADEWRANPPKNYREAS